MYKVGYLDNGTILHIAFQPSAGLQCHRACCTLAEPLDTGAILQKVVDRSLDSGSLRVNIKELARSYLITKRRCKWLDVPTLTSGKASTVLCRKYQLSTTFTKYYIRSLGGPVVRLLATSAKSLGFKLSEAQAQLEIYF